MRTETSLQSLKLNDFEGFDRFLLTDPEKLWRKYYDANCDMFFAPVKLTPSSPEVLYQLCHYALWMVMSTEALSGRPFLQDDIKTNCYSCEYAQTRLNGGEVVCKMHCPLATRPIDGASCVIEFYRWLTTRDRESRSSVAREIACIKWDPM